MDFAARLVGFAFSTAVVVALCSAAYRIGLRDGRDRGYKDGYAAGVKRATRRERCP